MRPPSLPPRRISGPRVLRLADCRGQVLPAALVAMAIVLLAVGLTADLGRALVARARLNAALEAAALSGALSGERYIEAECRGGYWVTYYDEDGCWSEWVPVSATYTGKEKDFPGWFEKWSARLNEADYEIVDRWGEFTRDPRRQARGVFDLNVSSNLGNAEVTGFGVDLVQGRGVIPTVEAFGSIRIPTVLLGNFGLDHLDVSGSAAAILQIEKP